MRRLFISVIVVVAFIATGAISCVSADETEFPKIQYFPLNDQYGQCKGGKIVADMDDQQVLKQVNIQQLEVMEVAPKTVWVKVTIRNDSEKPKLELVWSGKDLSISTGKNNH